MSHLLDEQGLPCPQLHAGRSPPQRCSRPQPQPSSVPDNDYFMLAPSSQLESMLSRSAPGPIMASPVFESMPRPATFAGQSFGASYKVPISNAITTARSIEVPQMYQHNQQSNLAQMGPTSHPRDYYEPLQSLSATPFLDEGLFEMEMPHEEFPIQQQYPEMSQHDSSQYLWPQQQVQPSPMLHTLTPEHTALDEAYLPSQLVSEENWDLNLPVGSMRGWIGRVPTLGEDLLPRLDTDLLAPPASSGALSPSSASSVASSSSRRSFSRRSRNQMTNGDFVCHWCTAAFPTSVELTHHLRSHAPYASRNHVCQHCEKRFQYRKDLFRHLPRHDPNRQKFYCPFKGCKYHVKGFGRRDHLDRHVISQHPRSEPAGSESG
jgi:hypothetical protein